MKDLLKIGTIEHLSLPDDQIQDIPAKIDTGADGSSIWATDIKLKADGKLVFKFFGPASPYYKNQLVITTAFRTITVRNSFGHEESRYKINLRVKVGTRTISCWFSLADRSRNNYPILLGKNFLKNRFIVDVAKKYVLSKNPVSYQVLVLGAQSVASKNFFKQVSGLNKLSIEYHCIGYNQLLYRFDGHNTQVLNISNGDKDLDTYHYAYFKTHAKHPEFAAAAAEYLQSKGRPFADHEVSQYVSASKLTSAMNLSCASLPIPSSVCAVTYELKRHLPAIVALFGYPFVLKEIASERGKHNYFISDEKEFNNILGAAPPSHIFIAQRYVPNDGFYRIYVFGEQIGLSIWRATTSHKDPLKKHLNKPVGSTNARVIKLADIPTEVRDLALQAADRLDRQVAGVDIVQDKATHKCYILEVNNAPQLRSGSFLLEKAKAAAVFFDKELSR